MKKILLIPLSFLLISCGLFKSAEGPALRIENVRIDKPENIKIVNKSISRKDYISALKAGSNLNKIRLVEVYNRGSATGSGKEYRFFEIKPGSVYEHLGLKNADILVAANGYVVPEQNTFWSYLHLIPNQSEAFIEIRRSGLPILLDYTFEE